MAKKEKNTKPFLLFSLGHLIKEKKINLKPGYQRDVVWTISQKQLLIDSILRDIDVPKLYFRSIDKGGYEYEVVDGQQRLTAVFDFLANKLSIDEDADNIDDVEIKGRTFKQLPTSLQTKFQGSPLDVVVLNSGYTDDDIEEIFTRLQNGTSLNAAEKRRAVAGTMRTVVASLATHKIFSDLIGFGNKRYANEDVVAKALHIFLHGSITDIRPLTIKKTYEKHDAISESAPAVVKLKRTYDFLIKAFKGKPSPKLKKYSMITLPYLANEMLAEYDIANHASEFADAYLRFEQKRHENEEKDEGAQDSRLVGYSNAARADGVQHIQYRHETLRAEIIGAIDSLALKDSKRLFTGDQRFAIYLRDKCICKVCGKKCDQDEYHADHIVPHSKGGLTAIKNGQLLCPACNLSKSSS